MAFSVFVYTIRSLDITRLNTNRSSFPISCIQRSNHYNIIIIRIIVRLYSLAFSNEYETLLIEYVQKCSFILDIKSYILFNGIFGYEIWILSSLVFSNGYGTLLIGHV